MWRRSKCATKLFVESGALEDRKPRTTILFRKHETDEPELGHLFPKIGRKAHRIVLHLAHDLDGGMTLANATHGLAQHLLFFGEIQIHEESPLSHATMPPLLNLSIS